MPRKKKDSAPSAEEITAMVMAKRDSLPVTELRDQMEDDFSLFTLDAYEPEPDHQAYTSPKPKNHHEKINKALNKAELVYNIALPDEAPKVDRDAANKGEDFLTAVFSQADRNSRNRGDPPLRESLGWFACDTGMMVARCLVYLDDSDEMIFDIRAHDPFHTYWEDGYEGLSWAAPTYAVSKAEALDRWGIEAKTDSLTLIDWFNRKYNAIVLYDGDKEGDSHWIKKPAVHGLDHVPVFVGYASSMPKRFDRNFQQQLKHRAASVFASSRGIYAPFNKQVSFIMDTNEKSVAGSMIYESEDGQKTVKENPYSSWTTVRIKIGEKLYPIPAPKVPPEANVIMGIIDRDIQESSVPYPVGYGLDPGSHSGAALSMLNENMRTLFDPYCSLLEQVYQWACEEILHQFKEKGKAVKLSALREGTKFFSVEAHPDDIHEDWYINVKVQPKLPRDQAGELQMALAATNPRPPDGRPFLSDATALEDILHIKSPDAEQERIKEQMLNRKMEAMPQIQLREMAKAMIDKGDLEGARELLASIPAPGPQPTPGGNGQQPGPAGPAQAPMMGQGSVPGARPMPTPEEMAALAAMIGQPAGGQRP